MVAKKESNQTLQQYPELNYRYILKHESGVIKIMSEDICFLQTKPTTIFSETGVLSVDKYAAMPT